MSLRGRYLSSGAVEAQQRTILTVLHVAMLSAVAVYALVLWALRGEILGPAPGGAAPKRLEWVLLAIGTAQYVIATELGKRLLPFRRGRPRLRVRSYFLIRFAAAEAIGIYGLMLGFLGASAGWVAALFGLSVVALLLAAPTRAAYNEALALAGQPRS